METIIIENTFAAACYEQNSIDELMTALTSGPDASDMQAWNLSEEEWVEQIERAISELRDRATGEN